MPRMIQSSRARSLSTGGSDDGAVTSLSGQPQGDGSSVKGHHPSPSVGTSSSPSLPATTRARLIAFYLPQFHPIPENDAWWGKGFTEWTNVGRARPIYAGHVQPLLPADLGFYDLRLPEAREAQADLAQQHGIGAFCYWHYWFHGKRVLERPFDEVLASGRPGLPFCLGWANESWSRSWLGDSRQIILEQKYSDDDTRAHAQWLAKAFADPRYVRISGRPLFLVYRPAKLPDPKRFTDLLRSEITRLGLPEPYLVGSDAHSFGTDMRQYGFDITEHHEPQLGVLPGALSTSWREGLREILKGRRMWHKAKVYRYSDARRWMDAVRPQFPHLSGYFVGWDNTARRGKQAMVIDGATPEAVGADLTQLIDSLQQRPWDERIVFINAWNEWAEGMYLEPDQKNGMKMLQAVAAANQVNTGVT